jgi:hypothetical protein
VKWNFTEWLLRQRDRDDEVADLAEFVLDDDCWPGGRTRLFALQLHLRRHGAERLVPALNLARREWRCLRGFEGCEGVAA